MVEENFEHVRVRGEISGFKGTRRLRPLLFHAEGFRRLPRRGDLADRRCSACASSRRKAWRWWRPASLTTFPSRSRYQIVVDHPRAGRRRRADGAARGAAQEARSPRACSTPARKKPIPYLPRVIGVVTSPTGAVIRDILHRLRDRFPRHVLVWPVRVQGEGAAEEVAAAVRGFNAIAAGGAVPRPDLLIVARGGGSIEDLWAFNEEVAVRAVAASRIPVIAAVGHETDWTLIDHAADLRAPTPTGAAEMAVPVRAELLAATRELASRHELGAPPRAWRRAGATIAALCRALPSLDDLLALRAPEARRRRRPARPLAPHRGREEAGGAMSRVGARLSPHPARRARSTAGASGSALATGAAARRTRSVALRGGAPAFLGDRRAPRHRQRRRASSQRQRQRFEQSSARLLHSYSYEAVLDRGFALVRRTERRGGALAGAGHDRRSARASAWRRARSARSSPAPGNAEVATLAAAQRVRSGPGHAALDGMRRKPIDRLRAICLALPEAEEKETWGDPTFRVRDKIFAMEKRGDGRVSVWCKAPPGSQMVLVGADPERFFVPPYVGPKGWVGVRLDDKPDWDEVARS